MYFVRVLVGEYIVGKLNIFEFLFKYLMDLIDIYDSVVD